MIKRLGNEVKMSASMKSLLMGMKSNLEEGTCDHNKVPEGHGAVAMEMDRPAGMEGCRRKTKDKG